MKNFCLIDKNGKKYKMMKFLNKLRMETKLCNKI